MDKEKIKDIIAIVTLYIFDLLFGVFLWFKVLSKANIKDLLAIVGISISVWLLIWSAFRAGYRKL